MLKVTIYDLFFLDSCFIYSIADHNDSLRLEVIQYNSTLNYILLSTPENIDKMMKFLESQNDIEGVSKETIHLMLSK